MRQSPTSGWLHNWMAGAYVERKDFDRALEEERLAVEYEPRAPAFHENLGNILLVRIRARPSPNFRSCWRSSPSGPRTTPTWASPWRPPAKSAPAAAEYETALRLKPDDREAQEGYRRVMTRLR